MRQGQQNRRGRGRGRRTQNPQTRNFESNGPDVKIRGTASHIAEKYSTLARDALSAGDPITAENYWQHAEHYNRIIMLAQQQSQPATVQPAEALNGSGGAAAQPHLKPIAVPADATPEKAEAVADGADGKAAALDGAAADGGRRRRRRTNANGEANPVNDSASKPADKVAKEEENPAQPNKNGAETPATEDVPPEDGAVA